MTPRDIDRTVATAAGGSRFAAVNLIRERANDIQREHGPRGLRRNAVAQALEEAADGDLRAVVLPTAADVTRALEGPVPALTPTTLKSGGTRTERIRCRECPSGAEAITIRKTAGDPRGRAPQVCALHGLPQNWEQVA